MTCWLVRENNRTHVSHTKLCVCMLSKWDTFILIWTIDVYPHYHVIDRNLTWILTLCVYEKDYPNNKRSTRWYSDLIVLLNAYLPEEEKSKENLQWGWPQHVQEGGEIHESLGIHRHQVDHLSHRRWTFGLICDHQWLREMYIMSNMYPWLWQNYYVRANHIC